MIIHPEPQGSIEWLTRRAGIPTASDFDQIVSPTGKTREGKMFDSYVAAKLSEAWTQTPHSDFTSWAADQGNILEEEARPWLILETGVNLTQVGLITANDGKSGCSPDGIADAIGAEIKCLQPTHHVKVLLGGKLPDEFAMQVQGGMYVTGFRYWIFCAYARRYPKLVLKIERDEEIQESISDALKTFRIAFNVGWGHLCKLNGGPPRRLPPLTPTPERGSVSRSTAPFHSQTPT